MSFVTGRPANDDMVQGYMDGRDLSAPEPSSNRSHSYRHGFMVGRNEKLRNDPIGSYHQVSEMADKAMDLDDQALQQMLS